METVISIRNLNHYFGSGKLRRQVLRDVCAEVLTGEIVIVTGPSGSGKTTLLTLVGALRTVQEGSVRTLDKELQAAGSETLVRVRREIGFVFQDHNLLDSLTAVQNVRMSPALAPPLSEEEARVRSMEMLAAVGLGDRVDELPRHLSGGQRQRVAIARALVGCPRIVLADEPTAALDRGAGREVVDLLHGLARRQGCAVLMVTHDNRILDIADRVLMLEDGQVGSFTAGVAASASHLLTTLAQLQHKGSLLRHLEETSDWQFLRLLEQMTDEFEQFLRSIDLANQEAIESLFDQVLEAVTFKVGRMLEADRATIYLVDEDRGLLVSKIAQHDGTRPLEIRIPLTSGIAGRVARTGETLNIHDAYAHPDFNREIDRRSGYTTRTILCMPIRDRGKKIFAVAQLLNKTGGRPFGSEDEQRLREFAASLGVILESARRLARDRS